MSDGTEQHGEDDALRTGEVRVPEGAAAVLPDDAIPASADSLGAAEWPAGEADEPHGQPQELAADDDGHGAGTASAEEERRRAERETDGGELTPSDPANPDQGTPPANLAEPLR